MTFEKTFMGLMIIAFIVIVIAEFVFGHIPEEDD